MPAQGCTNVFPKRSLCSLRNAGLRLFRSTFVSDYPNIFARIPAARLNFDQVCKQILACSLNVDPYDPAEDYDSDDEDGGSSDSDEEEVPAEHEA